MQVYLARISVHYMEVGFSEYITRKITVSEKLINTRRYKKIYSTITKKSNIREKKTKERNNKLNSPQSTHNRSPSMANRHMVKEARDTQGKEPQVTAVL